MHCTAQLFVDAMATRRHIRRTFGTEPVTMAALFEKLAVTDHAINLHLLVGATGDVTKRILFMDGSEAINIGDSEEHVWMVGKGAIKAGELPADFPSPGDV